MSTRVFKYELEVVGRQRIAITGLRSFLTVQNQHGRLVLWALVEPDSPKVGTYEIFVVMTGAPMPKDAGIYLGTVQLHDGDLVCHIFGGQPQ